MLQLAPLFVLCADIEKPHAGIFYPHSFLHKAAAQNGELLKHFGTAPYVRAAVQHTVFLPVLTGHKGHKSSPFNALYALFYHSSAYYDSRRASRAYRRVRLAVG